METNPFPPLEELVSDISKFLGTYDEDGNWPSHRNTELIAQGPALLARVEHLLGDFLADY